MQVNEKVKGDKFQHLLTHFDNKEFEQALFQVRENFDFLLLFLPPSNFKRFPCHRKYVSHIREKYLRFSLRIRSCFSNSSHLVIKTLESGKYRQHQDFE
jgi:hypothetical protein